jgi:hypothetical protein
MPIATRPGSAARSRAGSGVAQPVGSTTKRPCEARYRAVDPRGAPVFASSLLSESRTSVRDPAGRRTETLRNPLVVSALQASQELGHDKIPLRAAGDRWIPSALAKLWRRTRAADRRR